MNNNKGMSLQSHGRKAVSMEPCIYGPGCTRKDCIYRHDINVPDAKRTNEPCMAFLAGTCSFGTNTCKKRHPPKHEADRLRMKYKNIQCRHGNDCKTKSCLYAHPSDGKDNGEPAAFLNNSAFPPLDGKNNNGNNYVLNPYSYGVNSVSIARGSAWKEAPIVSRGQADSTSATTVEQPSIAKELPRLNRYSMQHQVTQAIDAQAVAWFPGNPQEESSNNHGAQIQSNPQQSCPAGQIYPGSAVPLIHSQKNDKKILNVNAKTWEPGAGLS